MILVVNQIKCLFSFFVVFVMDLSPFNLYLTFFILRASAEPKPLLAAPKMLTFGAGGVGGAFRVTLVVLASILHHGHKRCSLFRVGRFFQEVGIDHDRFAQRTLSVTFLIVPVPQLKGLAVRGYDLVEIALLVRNPRKR